MVNVAKVKVSKEAASPTTREETSSLCHSWYIEVGPVVPKC